MLKVVAIIKNGHSLLIHVLSFEGELRYVLRLQDSFYNIYFLTFAFMGIAPDVKIPYFSSKSFLRSTSSKAFEKSTMTKSTCSLSSIFCLYSFKCYEWAFLTASSGIIETNESTDISLNVLNSRVFELIIAQV